MKLRCPMLMVSLFLFETTGIAFASELVVPPTPSAQLVEQSFPGRHVDVVGLAPGMTAAAVKDLLKSKYPATPFDTGMGSAQISYHGVNARLDKFESAYRVSTKDGELLLAYMSTPATGSKVIGIQRSISYHDPLNAPEMNTLADALIEKYGKPSGDRLPTNEPHESSRIMTWYLTGTGALTCPLNQRKLPLCAYNVSPANSSNPEKAIAAGAKIGIYVMLLPYQNGTRVSSFSLQMQDYTNSDIDSKTTDTVLKTAVDKGLTSTPQAKPNL